MRPLLLFPILALFWTPLTAQETPPPAAPLTNEQIAKILAELETVESVVTGKRIASRSSAVDAFRKASASDKAAYEFYLACIKELRFDSRDARYSEFRDWRDRNEDKLKDPAQMTVMRLQLQYLVLTLRKAEGVEMEVLIPELQKFADGIAANVEELERSLKDLRNNVLGTPFAQLYELDQSLKFEDWSFTPGNIDSIYEKAILPFYRSTNPEMIGAIWDKRIDLQKRVVATLSADDEVALEKFQTERLPRLKWAAAKEVYLYASQPSGSLAMLAVLKANPDHPDATAWITEFRGMIPVSGAPSPTSTSSPTAPDSKPLVDENGFSITE